MKIQPVVAKLFHVDGETDMAKLIVNFRNFANMIKNQITNTLIPKLQPHLDVYMPHCRRW
jgi:hypothetical protein